MINLLANAFLSNVAGVGDLFENIPDLNLVVSVRIDLDLYKHDGCHNHVHDGISNINYKQSLYKQL